MNWRDLKPGDRVEITLTGVVRHNEELGVLLQYDDSVIVSCFAPEELDEAEVKRVVTQ